MHDVCVIFQSESTCFSIKIEGSDVWSASFLINIDSNGFAGRWSFCIPMNYIRQYVDQLKGMERDLSGSINIGEIDSVSTIEMGFNDSGAIDTTIMIEPGYDHVLRIRLVSDTSVLNRTREVFEKAIVEAEAWLPKRRIQSLFKWLFKR